MFSIEQCGFHIQLVDSGRKFCQFLGNTQSGPMDWVSYHLANAIVNNLPEENSAALECIGELTLFAESTTTCSVTGACDDVFINDRKHKATDLLELKVGDRLRVPSTSFGLRYYVAFSGGIDAPKYYGSVCDVFKEQTGGLSGFGEGLTVGSRFTLLKPSSDRRSHVREATLNSSKLNARKRDALILQYLNMAKLFSSPIKIPLILAYQDARFTLAQKSLFFSDTYQVSPQHSRMGIRMSGRALHYAEKSLYSEGISNGSVQIAGDGQPMILLADRQTIGGYPKIGSVGGYGLARLGQVKTGDKIIFYPVSAEECRQQRLISMELLHQL
ncbi:biotin-dependent carboxyltransferase family protein [Agaribacter marinus]|uniref:Allophanate hydrolase n=1 Tax=Agaribacter marinus TaxID=1431249 RepID=A0AA37WG75_9ALTE|nr:hypothetical protein [Agaribacter marinus]GLR69856.1 allophanate hydrolase [Agaribacter marinus]